MKNRSRYGRNRLCAPIRRGHTNRKGRFVYSPESVSTIFSIFTTDFVMYTEFFPRPTSHLKKDYAHDSTPLALLPLKYLAHTPTHIILGCVWFVRVWRKA